MADLQTSVAELTGVLAHTVYLKPHQFNVLSCAPSECVLKILFQPELERPGGLVSGMTLMGAGDVAMWLAIMTLRGVAVTWVTTDI